MEGFGVGGEGEHKGVAGFVAGGELLFFGVEYAGAAFAAPADFVAGFFEVFFLDGGGAAAGGEEGGFVHEVGEVGAGEAGGAAGDVAEFDGGVELDFAGVDFEDGFASVEGGEVHYDLAVEAAGAEEGGVEDVGAVGGGDDDDAFLGVEAVHFDEQGVEGLLAFVVAAANAGEAGAADGVNLVYEDDAGGVLFALLEHVADARGAYADEHFHEVGAGDGEEGDLGFAGDGAGDEGFAGAGWADEEYAFGDAAAEALELFGVAQEFDDFLDFFAGFVHAGDVLEGDFVGVARHEAGAGFAEAECAAGAAGHVAVEEVVDEGEDDQKGDGAGEDLPEQRVLRLELEGDVGFG